MLFEVLKRIRGKRFAIALSSALCLALNPDNLLAECPTLPAYNSPPSTLIGCAKGLLHDVAGDDLVSFFGFLPAIEITDSRFPQAYALPQGTIAISRGLLAELRSPDEFLFVVAHELGHEVLEASNTTALLTGARTNLVSPMTRELAADQYALALMKLRNRSSPPASLLAAELLERISHLGQAQGIPFSKLYPSIEVRLAALRAQ